MILAVALLVAGCIDFVEPDLPLRGAPAVIDATIRIFDTGRLEVSGTLAPGLDDGGLLRMLTRDSLHAAGFDVAASAVADNGSRTYALERDVSPDLVAGEIVFRAPGVEGVSAPPAARWHAARRLDPDTLVISTAGDLHLHIDSSLGDFDPAVDIRQWFLTLDGGDDEFRLSANGPPPDTIIVPPRWLPAAPEGSIEARLTYFQSARIGDIDADYIALFTLDARLRWVLVVDPPQGRSP